METIRVFIGWDPRESAAYHVCSQSIIENASRPISIHPLSSSMFNVPRGGSTDFTLSRYLIPLLCKYQGWAIFIDGDMVLDIDIAGLWQWKETFEEKAVAVVKHDYQTQHKQKFIGTAMQSPNTDYPRKNWSSVVLWNCAHPKHRVLELPYVATAAPSYLHRFGWLDDADIGSLTPGWNYLVGENPPSAAHLYHYTLGVPGMKYYADSYGSWKWHQTLLKALECGGDHPVEIIKRSAERVGSIEKVRAV
jgi:hypothetical protein